MAEKGKEFYSKSMKIQLKMKKEMESCEQAKHVEIFQYKQHNELHRHSPEFNKEIQ